ncbi:P12 [Parapoynx stagnalis nucleopolyhedrovirus]|uniref:P12 n=1 Tax=Parapoynx stagnalis nucleopolyhedrovirus TaxID=2993413 RepID=A0A9E7Y5Q8_9ABAC|nr:P12 [Parapoynx stagnalis nucleopolyhedrovirus]
MIASINDFDNSDTETRRNSPVPRPVASVQNAAMNVLQNMNTSKTVAAMILEDTSHQKIDSLKNLAPQSVAARKILPQMNAPSIPLNRNDTVDVLKLMSNIYDNTISVIITE